MLKDAAQENNEAVAIAALHKMVPTFTTPEEFNSRTVITKNDYKDYEQDKQSEEKTAVTVWYAYWHLIWKRKEKDHAGK